jgi:cysteine desulfurase
VALQAVNHETGVVQPVAEVAEMARQAGAWIHVDAVQAIGRVSVVLGAVDSWSIASHKLRGPKGIGALGVRRGRTPRPILFGGSQERGVRPGTVDPVAAAGFGAALRRAVSMAERYARVAPLRDGLETYLMASYPGSTIQGRSAPARAPHVVNWALGGSLATGGPELVAALDLEGISVSSGSACSAGTVEPSPVVVAMAGKDVASRAIRISMGEDTSEADLDRLKEALGRIAARLAPGP